jgi:hypothetical protein
METWILTKNDEIIEEKDFIDNNVDLGDENLFSIYRMKFKEIVINDFINKYHLKPEIIEEDDPDYIFKSHNNTYRIFQKKGGDP